ncbi:DUF4432 family protein [candidate division KSB3 bacterium]|uniref:DUF4432 family protein n=1 Tax=candidate division KSB3 bacterium TaxID=2044937 RepID=A0A9D5JUA3_9BACT|nr:DUF4432 family protein [candidate division KSB3 bacterium]MBD3323801.1 DUF4432 family protein [candidate division KSB3 bacterium]
MDGNARGVRAAQVQTGAGLNFTVLLDRGLDIAAADYRGQSLCWRSSTGDVAPAFFEPQGLGWLRGFYGGLLTTCGLTYYGAPDVDQGQALGLHGRVSHIPAKNVHVDGDWEGDDYVMWVQGNVQETAVFQENLVLRRKIWTRLGEKRLFIDDVVENVGYATTEHMMLYHINGGFPAVDEGTEIVAPFVKTEPRDDRAKVGQEKFFMFQGPTPGFQERVYYHDVATDELGYVYSALMNQAFDQGQGFGFYIKYLKEQLPVLVEWKMNAEGTYVVGMEPGTNKAGGRSVEREQGTLQFLEPGESRFYNLEIGVLSGPDELAAFRETVQQIKAGG